MKKSVSTVFQSAILITKPSLLSKPLEPCRVQFKTSVDTTDWFPLDAG